LKLLRRERSAPVGGRVTITVGDRRQVLPVTTGGSYLSWHDERLVAGWQHSPPIASIEVFWPSGRIDRFGHVTANRYWLLTEGRGLELLP
jgi:hypothetical protein